MSALFEKHSVGNTEHHSGVPRSCIVSDLVPLYFGQRDAGLDAELNDRRARTILASNANAQRDCWPT